MDEVFSLTSAPTFELIPDGLDAMADEAEDLLHRADRALRQLGAPPGHPVLSLIADLGVLPGEALAFLLGVQPVALREPAELLRMLRNGYVDGLVGPLQLAKRELSWGGEGYHAFSTRWSQLIGHLAATDPGEGCLADQVERTASYLDAVAGWFSQTRRRFAEVVADSLVSTAAVTLRGSTALSSDVSADPHHVARELVTGAAGDVRSICHSAAHVGASTLGVLDDALQTGRAAFVDPDGGSDGWPAALATLPYRESADGASTADYTKGVWVYL